MTASVRLVPPPVTAVQGRRAGVVTRTAAAVIDAIVLLTAVLIAYGFTIAVLFLWSPRQFQVPAPRFVVFLIVAGVLLTAYLTVCWTVTGRTYGDRILAVRVVDRRGDVPSLSTAGLRAAFCVVVPLGLFWTAINRNNRSLQDVLLRTSVIYDWQVPRPRALPIAAGSTSAGRERRQPDGALADVPPRAVDVQHSD